MRNLSDLKRFCADLLDKRKGEREIGFYSLEFAIAETFGYSKYIQESTLKALIRFKLLKIIGPNRYNITVGMTENEKKIETEEELSKYGV